MGGMAPVLTGVLAFVLLMTGPLALKAEKPESPSRPASAFEDSLRQELLLRQDRLHKLKDQIAASGDDDIASALAGLEAIIHEMEQELSSIEVEVREDAILFSNPSGDFRISIPEDLGARFSEGLSAITATILGEIPDSVDFQREISRFQEAAEGWSWALGAHEKPAPKRKKVIGSDVFAFDDDIVISVDERVQGDVISLFGDAVIMGEVDGQIFVLGGQLTLGEASVAHDEVTVLFGELQRDEQASIDGGVTVFNPGSGDDGLSALLSGEIGLLVKFAVIAVLMLLILVLFMVVPKDRLDIIHETIQLKGPRSFVAGLFWLTLGHILLVVILVVLVATVIGIPLALLLGLGYVLLGLMAVGAVARILGGRILPHPSPYVPMLIGLMLISLPGLLGAVFHGLIDGASGVGRLLELLGLMVHAMIYSLGSGALIVSRFGGRR